MSVEDVSPDPSTKRSAVGVASPSIFALCPSMTPTLKSPEVRSKFPLEIRASPVVTTNASVPKADPAMVVKPSSPTENTAAAPVASHARTYQPPLSVPSVSSRFNNAPVVRDVEAKFTSPSETAAPRVVIVSFATVKPASLSASAIETEPSVSETSPAVIANAFVAAVPVIATDPSWATENCVPPASSKRTKSALLSSLSA